MDIIRGAIDALNAIFNSPWLISVLLGLLLSWVITQRVKRCLRNYQGTKGSRWIIRVFLAAPIGAFPTWFTWPDSHPELRPWVSLLVGLASPLLYDLWSATRDHFWPWLRRQRQSKPQPKNPDDTQ